MINHLLANAINDIHAGKAQAVLDRINEVATKGGFDKDGLLSLHNLIYLATIAIQTAQKTDKKPELEIAKQALAYAAGWYTGGENG